VILDLPRNWLPPEYSLDESVIRKLVQEHRWAANLHPFNWVDVDDARAVGTYLVWAGTTHYWTWVVEGGVRGYSLYLHELIELKWLLDHNIPPFVVRERNRNYWRAHSQALVVEHRFLQVVARRLGHDFSLRELILNNPHGTPPGRDWAAVEKHRGDLLAPSDLKADPKRNAVVKQFYEELGFTVVR
jgi:hypothetical protein